MSGGEGAGPGEGGAMPARVFDRLQEVRGQQRRNSKQLERMASLRTGLTGRMRRMTAGRGTWTAGLPDPIHP